MSSRLFGLFICVFCDRATPHFTVCCRSRFHSSLQERDGQNITVYVHLFSVVLFSFIGTHTHTHINIVTLRISTLHNAFADLPKTRLVSLYFHRFVHFILLIDLTVTLRPILTFLWHFLVLPGLKVDIMPVLLFIRYYVKC